MERVPPEVDVEGVYEIRLLETEDGKEHGVFQLQGTDAEKTKEKFCGETEYGKEQVTVTDRVI